MKPAPIKSSNWKSAWRKFEESNNRDKLGIESGMVDGAGESTTEESTNMPVYQSQYLLNSNRHQSGSISIGQFDSVTASIDKCQVVQVTSRESSNG